MNRVLLGLVLLLLGAKEAAADTSKFTTFDLWPTIAERHFFSLLSSETLGCHQYSLDLANIYALHPLDVRNAAGQRVRSVVSYYFADVASAGLGITDFWQVGLSLPFFGVARFETPTDPSPGPQTVHDLGDLRIVSKIRLVDTELHRFGVAVEPFMTIPLGGDQHYLGETSVVGGGRMIGDVLITPKVRAALNIGAEFNGSKVLINNIDYRNRFLSNLGISADLGHRLTTSLEMQANSDLGHFFSDRDTTPVEFLTGIRWEIGEGGWNVAAGGGTCGVCGAKGAVARGFLNIGYRAPKKETKIEEVHPEEIHPAEPLILEPVYFGFNRVRITREMARTLKKVIETVKEHPEIRAIEVIGYADLHGTRGANKRISLKRARVVIQYLRRHGFPDSVRLIPKGVVARKGRRVVFRVVESYL